MLKENFIYLEGELIRINRAGSQPPDSFVGTLREDGYIGMYHKGKYLMVHRAIWVMHNGEIPDGYIIDHIDRNRANNKIENLRLVTPTENNFNREKQSNNKSGRKGVSWHKQKGKWVAQIKIEGRNKFLGFFDSLEEASKVYQEQAKVLHGELYTKFQ